MRRFAFLLALSQSSRPVSPSSSVGAARSRGNSRKFDPPSHDSTTWMRHSPRGTRRPGIHFVNRRLFAPGNPSTPEILLYAPRRDGSLELVGVEYWQADGDQKLGTSGDRPSVFGHGFDGPMLGHAPGMPIHDDLHVWVVDCDPLAYSRSGTRRSTPRRHPTITGATSGSDR